MNIHLLQGIFTLAFNIHLFLILKELAEIHGTDQATRKWAIEPKESSRQWEMEGNDAYDVEEK